MSDLDFVCWQVYPFPLIFFWELGYYSLKSILYYSFSGLALPEEVIIELGLLL